MDIALLLSASVVVLHLLKSQNHGRLKTPFF